MFTTVPKIRLFTMLLISCLIAIGGICIIHPSTFIKVANIDIINDWNRLGIIGGGYEIDGNKFKATGDDAGFIIPAADDYKETILIFSSINKIKSKSKVLNVQFYYPDKDGKFIQDNIITMDVPKETLTVKFIHSGKAGSNVRIDIGTLKGDQFSLDKIIIRDARFKMIFSDYLVLIFIFTFFFLLIHIINFMIPKIDSSKYITIYLLLILGWCLIFWLFCFFTRGEYFSAIFVTDTKNTFMDFFHSLRNANYDPYANRNSNYPAMACLIYRGLMHFIPPDIRVLPAFSLRNSMSAMMVFMVYNILLIWFMQFLIFSKSNLDSMQKTIFSLIIMVCAPFLFMFERGNLILLSFVLTLLFCLFYDSKNKYIREISFLALSFAAAIKIYPAVFGLLLLKKCDIKAVVRLTIYGIIAFFTPFFYYEGFGSFKKMISALIQTSNWEMGYGLNLSLYNIMKMVGEVFRFPISHTAITILNVAVIFILLTGFICLNSKWKKVLTLTLLIVLLPKTSYFYSGIFFIIPLFLFLNSSHLFINKDKMQLNKFDIGYAGLFAIVLIPWPTRTIPLLSNGVKFPVSYSMFLQYFAILGIVLLIALECIQKFIKNEILIRRGAYMISMIYFIFVISALVLSIL